MASSSKSYEDPDSTIDKSVNNLCQLFKCIICMESPKNARLCPVCSKFYCFNCTKKCYKVQPKPCANCRTPVSFQEFITCRWGEEVTVELTNLGQFKGQKLDMCQTHKEILNIYCNSCSTGVCFQCVLWEGSHSNHDIKLLNEVYKDNVTRIDENVGKLKRRKDQLTSLIEEIENNRVNTKRMTYQKMDENREAAIQFNNRLDLQLKSKCSEFEDQRKFLLKNSKTMDKLAQELVQERTASSSKNDFISICCSIPQFIEESFNYTAIVSGTNDLISEIVPEYDKSTFVIEDFSSLQKKGDNICSPYLTINGIKWELIIYPNGHENELGKYLSVFMRFVGNPLMTMFKCQIEMVYQGKDKSKQDISYCFDADFRNEDVVGNPKFYQLDLLASEGFLNMETDTLIFKFAVKSHTFYQKSQEQQMYIDQLFKENTTLKEKLALEIGKNQEQVTSDVKKEHERGKVRMFTRKYHARCEGKK